MVENLQSLNPDGAVLVSTPQVRRWCVCVCVHARMQCVSVSVCVCVNVCMLGREKDLYTSVSFNIYTGLMSVISLIISNYCSISCHSLAHMLLSSLLEPVLLPLQPNVYRGWLWQMSEGNFPSVGEQSSHFWVWWRT